MSGETKKPEIVYPCRWDYKIIGQDMQQLRAAAVRAAGTSEHTITESNHSQTGKYCSLALAATVQSEEHRNQIFHDLRADANVKMVF